MTRVEQIATPSNEAVEVVRTTFRAAIPEMDEWCYLAARSADRVAALNWANRRAVENQRRYLVYRSSFGKRDWLIYPENTERERPVPIEATGCVETTPDRAHQGRPDDRGSERRRPRPSGRG